MSEAVLDEAIEQIADGLTVDWSAFEQAPPARVRDWAKSLRVLNDIVKLHRDAAADYDQTTLGTVAAPAAAPSASPDTWGKYRLTNKVGEGSYGSVYRAWDSELERDVAIKILHRRVGDTRLRELLLQEGRALAKIQHNNVVRVLGIEAHGDRVGLCMEFVRGKTLADVVRGQGRLSAAEAVLIGEDLCRALSAVHRAGFIHRDVKAKNVMRDDNGRIVLMDFGTGRSAGALNKNDRAGTPLYMAPEVIEDGQQSARGDVYSLGVLLYYLVTGEYPVNARTIDELREAHARREHRWLSEVRPDLPVGFMQVVERAIALDPEERYANASELLAALSGLKTTAHPLVARGLKWLAVGLVVVLGMMALGALTSAVFNIDLQRSEFTGETMWDYLVWGRRTVFMPTMVLLLVLLGVALLAVVRRLVIGISVHARRFDTAVRRRAALVIHRSRLDEVSMAASFALLSSVVVLVATWWYFTPLMLAFLTDVVTGSKENLALLSPDFVAYHNRYRQVLTGVVIFCVAVWYPVATLVRKGQSLHWGFVVGGIVACCVAMAWLHVPYRLLYFNNRFDAMSWNHQRCYVTGERAYQVLLFCPGVDVPRNRVVSKTDEGLVPLGVRESIFSRFGSVAPGSERVKGSQGN
jgi:tRNA A-37 threonylcarbamoyl transferase component Bud32